ncbi:MAG: glycosyltransferase [Alphaproteobacteria bacterium]|nr:glycosyltransferase [Alphaproteobacteria bacterium]
MKNTHLVFCMPAFGIGGAEKVLVHLLDELRLFEHMRITVISNAEITNPFFKSWFNDRPDIKVHVLNFTTPRPSGFFSKNIWRIKRFIARKHIMRAYINITKDADLVIDYLNFHARRYMQYIKRPKVAFYHSSINYFVQDNVQKFVRYYDKVIALSDSFVADYKVLFPNTANKVMRIYNPIRIKEIQELACGADCPLDPKYFIVCCRMHWHKDINTVLYAFDKFSSETTHKDIKLYLVGDGEKRAEWQNLAQTLPSSDRIIFTGEKSNPLGYIKNAMALIMSSYNEGLPFVLCEAQSLNTLCIASNCKSGTGEIVQHGNAGLLFEAGDINGLANAMHQVADTSIDIQALTSNATQGLARFEPKSIALEIVNLMNVI